MSSDALKARTDTFIASAPQAELADGEEVAHCPSCSLVIRVIYNPEDFQDVGAPTSGAGDAPAVAVGIAA
jgi:hypothetical protein